MFPMRRYRSGYSGGRPVNIDPILVVGLVAVLTGMVLQRILLTRGLRVLSPADRLRLMDENLRRSSGWIVVFAGVVAVGFFHPRYALLGISGYLLVVSLARLQKFQKESFPAEFLNAVGLSQVALVLGMAIFGASFWWVLRS